MDYIDTLPLVVIVDDEREILTSIKRCLMRVDVKVIDFSSPRLALEFINDNEPAVIISDQRMPDISGTELLTKVKERWPNSTRIMLSAYQDFDQISDGFNHSIMHRFISKPWNNKELIFLVEDAISTKLEPKKFKPVIASIVGESIAMKTLSSQILVAAGANVPIFIYGETGTGKELVANACHDFGCKKSGKFIAINCANFSETLIESQLYGHKKGSFTGAVSDQEGLLSQSHGGTLFLDEITSLPLGLQAKLLRVLQEREYTAIGDTRVMPFDSQIIAASSVKLSQALQQGEFREDLYYRLNVIPLSIPPLRDREQDILLLARYFLKKFSLQHNKSFKDFSSKAQLFIQECLWPGNVRQLENTIHSVCIMNTGNIVEELMVKSLMADTVTIDVVGTSPVNESLNYIQSNKQPEQNAPQAIIPLDQVERNAIEHAVNFCEGNITKAAVLLEVNPSTIYRKIQKWEKV